MQIFSQKLFSGCAHIAGAGRYEVQGVEVCAERMANNLLPTV